MAILARVSYLTLVFGSIAIYCRSFGVSFVIQPQQFATVPATKILKAKEATRCYRLRQGQNLVLKAGSNNREDEIRRKIAKLKREGKIKNEPTVPQDDGRGTSSTPVSKQYGSKLAQKLGKRKAKRLGLLSDEQDIDDLDSITAELDAEEEEEEETVPRRKAQLGALRRELDDEDGNDDTDDIQGSSYASPESASSFSTKDFKNFNPDLFEDDDELEDEEEQMSEEELLDFVAQKLAEKRRIQKEQEEKRRIEAARKKIEELQKQPVKVQNDAESLASQGKTTTGIGGTWVKKNETKVESYKPKTGSWGYFERPKDISKAYGGGKRVGAGYTPDTLTKQKSEESTRDRLRQYREKVGIDVQSEKDHAAEIEQALDIGRRAMEVSEGQHDFSNYFGIGIFSID